MKKIIGIFVLSTSLLFVPLDGIDFEEFDTAEKSKKPSVNLRENAFDQQQRIQAARIKETPEKSFTKSAETKPASGIHLNITSHEPVKQLGDRSSFEHALKNKDLDSAKQMIKQMRDSHLTTEEFAKHLKETYDSAPDIKSLYPGKSVEQARKAFMKDLDEISPHVAKTFRDAFTVKKPMKEPQARDDEAYFDWLKDNPERIMHPTELHEPTPLEIAVNRNSPEMGRKIIEIAKEHKMKPLDIVDPLINAYKNIMKTKGEDAAYEYVQKVYDLGIERVSKIFYEHISKINFPKQG